MTLFRNLKFKIRNLWSTPLFIALVLLIGVSAFVLLIDSNKEAGPRGPQWGDVSDTNLSTSTRAMLADTSGWETYTYDRYNFSFKYPPQFTVGQFSEGEGGTIVVQNASARQGFQVYIQEVDEDIDITPERVRQDIPDMQVRDAQPVAFSQGGKQGLAFMSDNEAFGGNSREVWFTFNGRLYQVSTYASLDDVLQRVMSTWTFN